MNESNTRTLVAWLSIKWVKIYKAPRACFRIKEAVFHDSIKATVSWFEMGGEDTEYFWGPSRRQNGIGEEYTAEWWETHSLGTYNYPQSVRYTRVVIECIRYLPPFHRAGEERQQSSLFFCPLREAQFSSFFLGNPLVAYQSIFFLISCNRFR